jgi:hypothetical protein
VLRIFLVALALGGATLVSPSAAHAEEPLYLQSVDGPCGFRVINDITPDGSIGGTNTWFGIVYAAVAYADASAPSVSVSCILKINGGDGLTVLVADAGLPPAATSADTLSFTTTSLDDVVSLCAVVSIFNELPSETCRNATKSLVLWGDTTICPLFLTVGPAVDSILNPDRVYVAPDGDVYYEGGRIWDCPPYGV